LEPPANPARFTRVTEMVTRIKVALPSALPDQSIMALLVERAAKEPP
jgi:hypothetical protein